MATPDDFVALNFLEITSQPFLMSFYLKKVDDADQHSPYPNVKRYNLPSILSNLASKFVPYYISESAQSGFEAIDIPVQRSITD